jgi:predicted outer membrane repeat protein
MTAGSWIRRVFSPTARSSRRARARFRPAVVRLEDRLAPANFTVTTLADDGSNGSLRNLIGVANYFAVQLNQPSTISIPSSLYTPGFNFQTNEPQSTILLNGTQLPTILGQLSIIGDQTPVGNFGVPVWYISGEHQSRVFQVTGSGNLTLDNLTIDNGSTTDSAGGGGILNQGSLTLENVTVSANNAPNGAGGGIASTGPSMLIEHSIFTGNHASVSGGGVWTSGANATFNHDTISNNRVTGVDYSANSPSASPSPGGLAEGGGLDISSGNVAISFTTISGNAVQAGAGGPGSGGTSYDPSRRPAKIDLNSNDGTAGGTGNTGGLGGQAQGGGIAVDGGSLSIANSTLSHNTALGGLGGTGGAGGTGQGGRDGTDSFGFVAGDPGGVGGAGGQGGTGGAGGETHGGGLFVALAATNLTITDSTVADNQATGGQGGQSGAGGDGGAGGNGGAGVVQFNLAPGAGGVGGNGGKGGTTGAPGTADGAGLYFDPSSNTRQIAGSTIAFNNVSHGADAQPIIIPDSGGNIVLPASPGGKGALGGYPGQPAPQVRASRGADGANGVLGAAQAVNGGGLYENDAIFGVGSFRLNLINSIVAANTANTSSSSDITGIVAGSFDLANLIGSGGAGGLVDGQLENHVGVSAPGLLPLGNYGGETQTISLAANSPAIGAGDRVFNSLTIDQRGFSRFGDNNKLDIGAFELQQITLSPTLPNATEGTPYSQTVLATEGDFQNLVSFTYVGTLPTGLSLSTNGVLSGVPTAAGPFTFTVKGSDYAGSVSQQYTLTINPPSSPVVDTLADRPFDYDFSAGHLSLREALYIAQLPGVTSPVTFHPGLTGTITLTQGQLTIAKSMTIDGPGVNLLSISGNNVNRVFEIDSGSVTISGLSIINGNADNGGGILNNGSLTLDTVVVSHNTATGSGGGIYTVGPLLTVTGSTIPNNNAPNGLGGGIYNYNAPISVVNSTIAGNSAGQDGGGIYTYGISESSNGVYWATDDLTNVTTAANTSPGGKGVSAVRELRLNLTNTIIGDGLELQSVYGVGGAYDYYGGNLIVGSNIAGVISADPKLGPLQNNGGPTPTMALLPGSPAIDAGVNSYALDAQGNPLTTDQNGFQRISGAKVDLGAYEMQPASLGTAPANGQVGTSYSQTVTATQSGYQASWGTFNFAVTGGSLPTGLSLSPTGVLSGTPTAAGTFTFTVTASDLAGFGSQQYSVTISPATPTVSVNPVNILYGTPLANSQLSGTATVGGNSVPGTITYTSAAGTVLGAGNGQSEAVTFTPTDSTDYTTVSTNVVVNVAPVPTSISVSASSTNPAYGQGVMLTATLNTPAGSPTPTSGDGTVTFYDGPTMLGTPQPLSSGATAMLTNVLLTAGQHAITAVYSGDNNFVSSQFVGEPTNVQLTVPASGLNFPESVAVDSARNVYIADTKNNQVVALPKNGSQFGTQVDIGQYYQFVGGQFTPTSFSGPFAVAAGGAGVALVTDGTYALVQVPLAGTAILVGYGIVTPPGQATNSRGDVFIADPAHNQVEEVKADGTVNTVGSGLNQPYGVAVDAVGDVFIADSGNNRVVEVIAGVPVTVSPANAQPSVTGYSVSYDGNSHTATATATDVNGNPLPASDFNLTATTHTTVGTYTDAWTFHDPSGNYQDANGTVSDTIRTNAATVAAVQVNDGSAQRSEVRLLRVTFSGPVTFAGGNVAAAFQLLHVQTGKNVALSATTATDSLGRTVVTLGFSGGDTDPVSGLNGGIASLADGRYQLSVAAADVVGPGGIPLAGDGTDVGSNYVSPADTYQGNGLHLYRLFGDVNGDGVVDATDVGQLKSTFNRNNTDPLYLWYLDADNSGAVDASDIGQFKSRFNVNVFG